jgi:hypothetical protein
MQFYTVLFGVSRAFGVAAQLIWDRALGARGFYLFLVNEYDTYVCYSPGTSKILFHRRHQEDVSKQGVSLGLYNYGFYDYTT